MIRKPLTLLLFFIVTCTPEKQLPSIDGRWVGYAEITQYKYLVEFVLESDQNKLSGEMMFYTDTMQLLEGSVVYRDSVVMVIDYVIPNVDFVFKGEILGDTEAIRGFYTIDGPITTRTEPFEIYKEIR